MKIIKEPGINNSTYLFGSPHEFNNFNKYLFNDELPKQVWTGDKKDRALSLHHDRDKDLIDKIDNLIKFKQDSSASPKQSGELDHNDMIMLHYLNSSDVVGAISYALMLKGLGIPDEDRRKIAQDIVEKNSNDFDLTPDSIRKFVDNAASELESHDDNFDYDSVYDNMIDDYLAEHETEDTDVSGLAKSITQQDLGRTFDKEEE